MTFNFNLFSVVAVWLDGLLAMLAPLIKSFHSNKQTATPPTNFLFIDSLMAVAPFLAAPKISEGRADEVESTKGIELME